MRMLSSNICRSCNARHLRQLRLLRRLPTIRPESTSASIYEKRDTERAQPNADQSNAQSHHSQSSKTPGKYTEQAHLQSLLARYKTDRHVRGGRYSRYQDPGALYESETEKGGLGNVRDGSNSRNNNEAVDSTLSSQLSFDEWSNAGSEPGLEKDGLGKARDSGNKKNSNGAVAHGSERFVEALDHQTDFRLHHEEWPTDGSEPFLEGQSDYVHLQPVQAQSKGSDRIGVDGMESNNMANNRRAKAIRPSKPSSTVAALDSSTMGPATRLSAMMKSDVPFNKLWAYFNEHFMSRSSPALAQSNFSDKRILSSGQVFRDLVWKAIDEWYFASDEQKVPDPLFVAERMIDLGIAQNKIYAPLLWRLTVHLIADSCSHEEKGSAKFMGIIEMWRIFFFRCKTNPQTGQVADDWSCLPNHFQSNTRGSVMLLNRLQELTPNIPKEASAIAPAAIAIMSLILHERGEFSLTEAQVERCWPLVAFLAEIIGTTRTDEAVRWALSHKFYLESVPPSSLEKWKYLLTNAPLDAKLIQAEIRSLKALQHKESTKLEVPSADDAEPTSTGSPEIETTAQHSTIKALDAFAKGFTLNSVDYLTKRAFRATESSNLSLLQQLWREGMKQSAEGEKSKDPEALERMYSQFLKLFMKIKNPSGATMVWNTMMQRGFKPTDRVWTAALAGCAAMEDYQALEEFWERMLASGHQPSAHAWTARIYGTVCMGRKRVALQALDSMGRAWALSVQRHAQWEKSKDKKKFSEPAILAKPARETVNAALSALTRRGNRKNWEDIDNLLQWAKAYGIKADNYTYNPLIRFAFLMKDPKKAFNLIAEMEKEGIEPDGATSTILIREMFQMSALGNDEPPEVVEKRVRYIIQDLKARKVLNRFTCSALVDGLAKQGSIGAIQVVLDEIVALGQNVPAPVYTILSKYYFALDPPNIAAADTLYNRAMGPYGSTDIIFMDNMIKGYSSCGEYGKMMMVLMQMSKSKKPPGWGALVAVIEGLYQNNDLNGIAEVVQDVRKGGGRLVVGVRVRSDIGMQDYFWQLVEELGLNDKKELDESQKKLGSWMADNLKAAATSNA